MITVTVSMIVIPQPAMCRIMLTCFHTIKDKLHNRLGYFELLGFDFILDATLKVKLSQSYNIHYQLSIAMAY